MKIKNITKRKIARTRRLALALSLSYSLYKTIESKTNPKTTKTIINNIK